MNAVQASPPDSALAPRRRAATPRLASHDRLVVDDAQRHAIGRRALIEELRRLALVDGMRTFLKDGLDKVQEGLTELRQLLTVCSR